MYNKWLFFFISVFLSCAFPQTAPSKKGEFLAPGSSLQRTPIPLTKQELYAIDSVGYQSPFDYWKKQAAWMRENLDKEGQQALRSYLNRFYQLGFLLCFDHQIFEEHQVNPADIDATLQGIWKILETTPLWWFEKSGRIPFVVSFDPTKEIGGKTEHVLHRFGYSVPSTLTVNVHEGSKASLIAKFITLHEIAHYRWGKEMSHYNHFASLMPRWSVFSRGPMEKDDFEEDLNPEQKLRVYLAEFCEKAKLTDVKEVKNLISELVAYTANCGDLREIIYYLKLHGVQSQLNFAGAEYEKAQKEFENKVKALLKAHLFRNHQANKDGSYTYVWPYVQGDSLLFEKGSLREKGKNLWEEVEGSITIQPSLEFEVAL